MVTKKNKGYLLETMEEGQNKVSYGESVEIARMEGARNVKLSQGLGEQR